MESSPAQRHSLVNLAFQSATSAHGEPRDVRSTAVPLRRLTVPLRQAFWEFLAVLCAAVLSRIAYLDVVLNSDPGWFPYLTIAVGLGLILFLTYHQMGLYEIDKLAGREINFGKILGGLAIAFLIVLGALYVIKQSDDVSRGWVLAWLVSAAILVPIVRVYGMQRVKQEILSGGLRQRIAIIGTEEYANTVATCIQSIDGGRDVIDLYGLQADVPAGFTGDISSLIQTMSIRRYDRVFVAIPAKDPENIRAVVKSLGPFTTELLLCSDLAALPIFTSGARCIGGIRADVVHFLPGSENSWILKRALDVTIACIALLALLPVFVVIALAIKLDSRGPVIFIQRRLGQNNAVFSIYKFRSMFVAEDGPVVIQAKRNDNRVTRVGRFLRSTSIDELPQLFNVLFGEMSLIGPRPHAIAHDQAFEQQFDQFSRRRCVKPGMSGWAQVNGFRGETKTPDTIKSRMEHDLYYIDHWSIWLDIEIIVRTTFVFAKHAY